MECFTDQGVWRRLVSYSVGRGLAGGRGGDWTHGGKGRVS